MPRLPRGNAEATLDAKGRVAVPAKFRAMFEGKHLVLWEPLGQDNPYLVLTSDEFIDAAIERELKAVPKERRVAFNRSLSTRMEDIELDTASRFVINEKHNEKTGFVRGEKLFLIANKTYIEIWSLQAWKDYDAENQQEDLMLLDYTPDGDSV